MNSPKGVIPETVPCLSFFNPVKIEFGIGVADNIQDYAASLGDKILLIRGKSSLDNNVVTKNMISLISPLVVKTIQNITPNPDIQDIYNILIDLKHTEYNLIIAVGGGSVMDTAKAVSAFHGIIPDSIENMRIFLKDRIYSKNMPPIIAIPTTAGTGSEANQWGVIWDKANNTRGAIADAGAFPKYAVVDPRLTANMPLKLTGATAFDALCHAMEGYWAKRADSISKLYAIKSIKLVMDNLEPILTNLEDMNARSNLALASTLAGVSLSIAKTTACHAISYPLTLDYNIDHGIACVLTLDEVFKYNYQSIQDVGELNTALGIRNVNEFKPKIQYLANLCGINLKLSEYDIPIESLANLAKKCLTKGNLDNNLVTIGESEILTILQRIY